jgi:exodeoxyribonuclease V alpha subunit
VLGDLCRSAQPERGVGAALAASVAAATGMVLPVRSEQAPLADVVVTLRQNHRFGSQPGIGGFAAALAERDAAAAMAALRFGHQDLLLAADAEAALQSLQPLLLATVNAPSAAAALATLDRLRILCATRHGPQGVAAWNRRVEALLAAAGHRSSGPDYRGRPVLITANDHQNRLYNGDLGVVWPDDEGRSQLWLPTSSGALRSVSLLRLPAHETAWAMTVHKAQGSEFDTVLLVMPERDGPLWAAPLLYTAVSRARRRAMLLADSALLTAALARWPTRSSGLADAIAEPS